MNYIPKRIIATIITLFLVSVFCFLIFSVIRGDAASSLGGLWLTPEQLETLREEMGLDENVFVRYFNWLVNFISGNPGHSYSFRGEAISALISNRLPVTVSLALFSVFLILIISFSVSLFTAKREGSITDNIVNFFTAAGISTPGFFLGLLFIFIFGFGFNMMRIIPGNFIDYNENFFIFFGSLFFPALAIAIPNSAILIKFLRGSIFSELQKDYVRTAKSKGAGDFYILFRHVFKNACLPAVTMLGMIIAEVFSGSIIIEQVFQIPGIGMLLISAISSRDYPLIQALMVYIAFIVITANTLADIVIMIIDPKIKQARKIR
ncbi:MAG: ABC transporter permease [Treponema sp.]|nr:ABC transporter permease [Treponema sp.]